MFFAKQLPAIVSNSAAIPLQSLCAFGLSEGTVVLRMPTEVPEAKREVSGVNDETCCVPTCSKTSCPSGFKSLRSRLWSKKWGWSRALQGL